MSDLSIIALPLEAAKKSGFRYVTIWTRAGEDAWREAKVFETLYEMAQFYKKQIIDAKWKDIENSLDEHKVWKGSFDPSR